MKSGERMNRNNHIKKDEEIAIKSEDKNDEEEKIRRVSIYNIKSSHPLFNYSDCSAQLKLAGSI